VASSVSIFVAHQVLFFQCNSSAKEELAEQIEATSKMLIQENVLRTKRENADFLDQIRGYIGRVQDSYRFTPWSFVPAVRKKALSILRGSIRSEKLRDQVIRDLITTEIKYDHWYLYRNTLGVVFFSLIATLFAYFWPNGGYHSLIPRRVIVKKYTAYDYKLTVISNGAELNFVLTYQQHKLYGHLLIKNATIRLYTRGSQFLKAESV